MQEALAELSEGRRAHARTIIVLISDGNSQDEWLVVQKTAKALREVKNAEVYAVTLSAKYYFDELKEYTGNVSNIYTDERVEKFIQVRATNYGHLIVLKW